MVAIDFPGHGFSSHLPAGCPYNDYIFVIEVERVVQKLGWKNTNFTILGHSMGAAIGLFYSCLHPKTVQRIITLDMIKPLTFPPHKLAEKTREGIQSFLQLDAKSTSVSSLDELALSKIPLYDKEQAIKKLIAAHSVFGKISPQSAEYLLKRGSKPLKGDDGKVYFTRDNRLKAMLFQRIDNDSLAHYFNHLECELLIIKADNGVKLDHDDVSNRYIELYREKCKMFEMSRVAGGHHVHLCQPESICSIIVNFIDRSNAMNEKSVQS